MRRILPQILRLNRNNFTYVGPRQIKYNMGRVYEYIDERAAPNSVILGSSNPILPPSPLMMQFAAQELFSRKDIYEIMHSPQQEHQREGNTLRYYSSRSGRGTPLLRQNLEKYLKSQGFKTEGLDFWFSVRYKEISCQEFADIYYFLAIKF